MSLRRKIVITAVVLLMAIGLAVCCYLLIRGVMGLRETEGRLARDRKNLEGFYKRDPFPSDVNVAQAERNVEALEGTVKKLAGDLGQGNINAVQTTPATFVTLLGNKKSELIGKAKACGVAVAENFAFGFERYDKHGSALPAIADMPILAEQLATIEKVCGILFQERIRELTGVVREDPENKKAATSEPVQEQGSSTNLYAMRRFVFDFKAKESSVLGIMNQIAKDATFMIVSSVQFEKESPDVVGAGGAVAGSGGGRVRSGEDWDDEAPASNAKQDAALVPRAERIVCGVQTQKPMKVKMTVDVYSIRSM